MDQQTRNKGIDSVETAEDLFKWVLQNYDCSKKLSMLDRAALKNYWSKIISIMGLKEK